jgi:Mg/Co/Ni transporter MgtE
VDEVRHRQVVDVDGAKVLRAGELWLAAVLGRMRLVAVEGERRFSWWPRHSAHAGVRLVDWAGVQPLGEPGSELRLQVPHEGLRKLRPGELADLLEGLDRDARDELADSLDPAAVADALEEMEPEPIMNLLRDAPRERAAKLVAAMEPDEAADALRDMERGEADAIIKLLAPDLARQLTEILGYPETMAGGFMTTTLARARPTEPVADVRERLAGQRDRSCDIDGVVVVDDDGRLLADLSLFDLFVATEGTLMGDLVGEVPPIAVRPEAFLDEVVDRMTDARRPSVVVVDAQERPIGRVLADDVVDALREGGLRMRLPWLFR